MNLSRTAAAGALLQAAHFILIIILTVLISMDGIAATDGGLYNPELGLAYALRSPMLMNFHIAHLLMVFGMIPMMFLFHRKLSPGGGIAVTVAGFTGFTAILLHFLGVLPGLLFRFLAQSYSVYPVESQAAYLAIILVSGAFLRGGGFANGWWLLLVSFAGLRTGVFPKSFNLLGVLVGIAGIFSLFITQLDIAGLAGLIWLIWLAVILLREHPVRQPTPLHGTAGADLS
jgi:hypothetical protein